LVGVATIFVRVEINGALSNGGCDPTSSIPSINENFCSIVSGLYISECIHTNGISVDTVTVYMAAVEGLQHYFVYPPADTPPTASATQ
jgi:hypothetical protein